MAFGVSSETMVWHCHRSLWWEGATPWVPVAPEPVSWYRGCGLPAKSPCSAGRVGMRGCAGPAQGSATEDPSQEGTAA